MPHPPLEQRPPFAAPLGRNKQLTGRGHRIVNEINRQNVTLGSVARRAGYELSTVYAAIMRGSSESNVLDCVEEAIGLPVWSRLRTHIPAIPKGGDCAAHI